MKIIAITRRIGEEPEREEARKSLLTAEIFRAWQLQQSGFIREMYLAPDQKAAVLVVEARTTEEARDRLSTLPMVAEGLLAFDLMRLSPYPSFAQLFRSEFVEGAKPSGG